MTETTGGVPDDDTLADLYLQARTVASRIVGRQAAPDIASETTIRALVRWRRVRDHATPWVTVTATNLAIDALRKHKPNALPPAASTPDDTELAATRLDLAAALRRLPRRQRQVIALRYLVGLSEIETADTLQVSITTVKTHAARAFAALRKTLTPEEANHAT